MAQMTSARSRENLVPNNVSQSPQPAEHGVIRATNEAVNAPNTLTAVGSSVPSPSAAGHPATPLLRRLAARFYSRLHGSTLAIQGDDNQLSLGDSVRRNCRIRISGNRNRVEFGPGCRLWNLNLEIVGDDHRLFVGAHCAIRGGNWLLEDHGSRLTIGAATTMIEDQLVASEGFAITLGDDCMLGANVDIRCSDGHSIIDRATGTRVNPPSNITIGRHVWLTAGARVLKGVTIGDDTIVAASSVVTKPLPAGCVAAGIPARPVRHGVTWDRSRLAWTGASAPADQTK